MAMHPSLDHLRVKLGLYELSHTSVASSTVDRATPLVANWPCGCSASGADMRSMEHFNCKRHERVNAPAVFKSDRRKSAR